MARYRSVTSRDLPLDLPPGDSDLRPVFVLLWLSSIIRVALTFWLHHSFGAEATLALSCSLLLPWFLFRRETRTIRQGNSCILE
jgi:hypothetical protein